MCCAVRVCGVWCMRVLCVHTCVYVCVLCVHGCVYVWVLCVYVWVCVACVCVLHAFFFLLNFNYDLWCYEAFAVRTPVRGNMGFKVQIE
jgi:hypothetical protein